jgi:molybdopterin molybdotransferase
MERSTHLMKNFRAQQRFDDGCVLKKTSLLSIGAACDRAAANATPIEETETVQLIASAGRTLGETICARVDSPLFDNSAMDGYAFHSSAITAAETRLHVGSRIVAGRAAQKIAPGTAARIFTGAPIPPGADTVVVQERAVRDGNWVQFEQAARAGDNIRRRGEDTAQGDVLLHPGKRLDARHIALLAGQGIDSVRVRRRPRIAIVTTGLELRQPGEHLQAAEIYDSNRSLLLILGAQAGAEMIDGGCMPDDPDRLASQLIDLRGYADLFITSGGASVGEEDHIASALAIAGADHEVLRIAMKPGKPAIVGKLGCAGFLGLSGNPVAALVGWLLLGDAMLSAINGRERNARRGHKVRILEHLDRRPGRAEFIPVKLVTSGLEPGVTTLGPAGSACLRPITDADGLIEISADSGPLMRGEMVAFHPFNAGLVI